MSHVLLALEEIGFRQAGEGRLHHSQRGKLGGVQ